MAKSNGSNASESQSRKKRQVNGKSSVKAKNSKLKKNVAMSLDANDNEQQGQPMDMENGLDEEMEITSSDVKNNPGPKSKNSVHNAASSNKAKKRGNTVKLEESIETKKKKVIDFHLQFSRGSGVVLTLGQNDVGQLGLGENVSQKKNPSVVNLPTEIVDICAGGMHTVCLTKDGVVYTFGCNDEGALGRLTSESEEEFEPKEVDLPQNIVQISAGDSHSAALTEDGKVFIWGTFRDSSGAMGLITTSTQRTPYQILKDVPILKIASGNSFMIFLTTEGTLYSCGCAEQGQLGRVAECFSHRGGRKGLDVLLNALPVVTRKVKNQKLKFDDVWAGAYCTFARASKTSDVYCWGLNNYHQLGFEDEKNRYVPERSRTFSISKVWQKIACGQHHTLALDSEGKVYSLGRKEYGRLGLGEDCEDVGLPTLVPALKDLTCVDIACGIETSFAVTNEGAVYAWGMGTNGDLGTGDEEDRYVPEVMRGQQLQNRKAVAVSSGGQHTVILALNKTSDSN